MDLIKQPCDQLSLIGDGYRLLAIEADSLTFLESEGGGRNQNRGRFLFAQWRLLLVG